MILWKTFYSVYTIPLLQVNTFLFLQFLVNSLLHTIMSFLLHLVNKVSRRLVRLRIPWLDHLLKIETPPKKDILDKTPNRSDCVIKVPDILEVWSTPRPGPVWHRVLTIVWVTSMVKQIGLKLSIDFLTECKYKTTKN